MGGEAMRRSVPVGEVRRFGDRAFLIGVEDAASGRELAAALRSVLHGEGGAPHAEGGAPLAEVVGGQATVLVALADDDADPAPVRDLVERLVRDVRPRRVRAVGASRRRGRRAAGDHPVHVRRA